MRAALLIFWGLADEKKTGNHSKSHYSQSQEAGRVGGVEVHGEGSGTRPGGDEAVGRFVVAMVSF
jgi:hypothetical protein